MPRDIPVGNGSLLVTFDEWYRIRDIYFPHVGKENHSEGHPFRFGVWVDGHFSWISDEGWKRDLRYLPETLVTDVRLTNTRLGLELESNDVVDVHSNIFVRRLRVKNLAPKPREVRLFFHHDFYISETEVGDTAYFDPDTLSLIHYKGARYFLINTDTDIETFATGRKAFQGAEGTWRDAEDGKLEGRAITEGSVDSTIGRILLIGPGESEEMYYWIAAGTSYKEVAELDKEVRACEARHLIQRTADYWRAWVNKNELDFGNLGADVVSLFKRSLLIMRTQIDIGGAIIAGNDSDVTLRATDHYSYLWPRDGALVSYALDLAGYSNITRSFFDLCGRIVTEHGYFLQKYNPDGTLASGWHAGWDTVTRQRLVPIQEDETALVLWALWNHYDEFRDIEFARTLYHSLVTKAADFMATFRDEKSGLPEPSWNLWEDRRGIHTFTCASVVAGLRAASKFAELFGDTSRSTQYATAATEVQNGMRKFLYREELGRFARSISPRGNGDFEVDGIIDSSLFGIFYFGAFAADDAMVSNTMQAVYDRLWARTEVGGLARYEHDEYMRVPTTANAATGNPWFICTLWLAEYRIASSTTLEELEKSVELLEWVVARALPSGVLAEQVDPVTGAPLSVSPLTWSHATVVSTTMAYLKKLEALLSCEACHRPLFRYDRRARKVNK